MSEKHIFAFYVPDLDTAQKQYRCLSSHPLYHRLAHVMRGAPGDELILFNQQIHVTATIASINKKELVLQLDKPEQNQQLNPKITMLVSITKQDALEEAVYACAEFGASVIQPVITEKAYRQALPAHALQRIQAQIIAGAEQAKHFAFPTLKEPIALTEALAQLKAKELFPLFFDPEGQPLALVLEQIKSTKPTHIAALVGPEGDLTNEEKALLTHEHVTFCALTPTILRAPSATALGLGILRSYLKS